MHPRCLIENVTPKKFRVLLSPIPECYSYMSLRNQLKQVTFYVIYIIYYIYINTCGHAA